MSYDQWKLATPPHYDEDPPTTSDPDDQSNWTEDDWAADAADRYNDDRARD